jgi:DNA polymerase-1
LTIVYKGIHSNHPERWEKLIAEPPSLIAIDTEVYSLSDRTLLGLGIAPSGDEAFYVTSDDVRINEVLNLMRDPNIKQVYHNAPFDIRVMRPFDVGYHNVDDTAIMLRLLGHKAVLEGAAYMVGRSGETAKAILNHYKVTTMDKVPLDVVGDKCCNDAQITYLLREHLIDQVPPVYYQREVALIPIMETVSKAGIRLDPERIDQLYTYYNKEYAWYLTQAEGMGFNPGSPQQVAYVLAARGNFLPLTKSKKGLSTDESVLKKLTDPVAQLVLLFRHVAKMKSTYVEPFRGQTRAYTSFHMDAITGRISSTNAGEGLPDRNLNNIPKKVERGNAPTIRSAFLPDDGDGVLTCADYSQIELRVLAHISQDQRMLSVFLDPKGDIHEETCKSMRIKRDFAKTFNFAMIYGGNEWVVAENAGISDIRLAREYMKRWMATYPQAAQWMLVQENEGMRNGYVESLYGRKMPIPQDRGQAHAKHCCVNYPIQCTAGEIFKMAVLECQGHVDRMRLLIYDESVLSGQLELPEVLGHISEVQTPLSIEFRERWG